MFNWHGGSATTAGVPLGMYASYTLFHLENMWVGLGFLALSVLCFILMLATLSRYFINYHRTKILLTDSSSTTAMYMLKKRLSRITSVFFTLVVLGVAFPAYAAGGVVSLTFDDGNASQYQYAASLLNAASQKGVFYTNSGFVGTPTYMTWAQLTALKNAGHEVAGHTLTHLELPTLSQDQKLNQINRDFTNLANRGFAPQSFAVPFGAYDNTTTALIAKKFDSMRAFKNQGLNIWPYNKYLLYVRPITNTTTVAEVKTWVEEAVAQDAWLVLVFHEILPVVDPTDDYSWTTTAFEEFLSYLNQQGIKAKTVKEALARGTNLVQNASFETNFTGWTFDVANTMSINTASNGSYPTPRAALRVTGNSIKNAHLFSAKIPVTFGTVYGFRAYTDSRLLTAGEGGFYIDEYDASGAWVSGKWLGAISNQNVIDKAYAYTPTSSLVQSVSIQIYVTAGTTGSFYVDGIELYARSSVTPQPPQGGGSSGGSGAPLEGSASGSRDFGEGVLR